MDEPLDRSQADDSKPDELLDRSQAEHREPDEIAAMVRDACVQTIEDAYEDAGIRGLCGEGRFEAAIEALRRMDIHQVLSGLRPARRG